MKEVERYLKTRTGKYSFFFEDLNKGYSYGYNENVKSISAGCMKLPIAVALMKCEEEGKVDYLQKIKIVSSDKVFGTGIIHEFGEKEYTVFELLVAMLIQSDNTAANKIIDTVSMERINETIKDLGMVNTELNRKTADERNYTPNVENYTSAKDLCILWKALYNNAYLNPNNSQMLIDILARQQIKNKLALYITDDYKYEISSKTGDKKGVENDTELIHTSKGNFALTVMSSDIPNSVYGTITLAKTGKMIWDNIMNKWS
ncbi:MAG: serine hydrolase [Clostridium perfringens]|nr:serine hydrolase [Clostridium perfringens]